MINRWCFSGYVTRAEEYERGTGGFECLIHVHIPMQGNRHVWAAVIWRGKAAQAGFHALEKGCAVFVDGTVGPRNEVASEAVIVNAKNVVIAQLENEGADND